MKSYDIVIIGAGPAGYVAAIKAAQNGLKTAIIEKEELGGTCLNVGCIPSKTMLDASENFSLQKVKNEPDFNSILQNKDKIIKELSDGIAFVLKKNGVDVYFGTGSFFDKNIIKVVKKNSDQEDILSGKNIIIATGSKVRPLENIEFDADTIINSSQALNLGKAPKNLLVIGCGVIGVELATVFKRFGSNVIFVEYSDKILGNIDQEVSNEAKKILKKQGFEFHLGAKIKLIEKLEKGNVKVTIEDSKSEMKNFSVDCVLIAAGRIPNTENLNLSLANIEVDDKSFIKTDNLLRTSTSGVYAIGDVKSGAMLAHKAEDEAIFVIEHILGEKPHLDYNLIPAVVYITPEIAYVGKTTEQLKAENRAFKVGKYPFKALGRAKASAHTEGFVKILADAQTDEVLGIHIIGAKASELIFGCVLAMEYKASCEDLARISYAHPSFSEAIKEAAQQCAFGKSIHG